MHSVKQYAQCPSLIIIRTRQQQAFQSNNYRHIPFWQLSQHLLRTCARGGCQVGSGPICSVRRANHRVPIISSRHEMADKMQMPLHCCCTSVVQLPTSSNQTVSCTLFFCCPAPLPMESNCPFITSSCMQHGQSCVAIASCNVIEREKDAIRSSGSKKKKI